MERTAEDLTADFAAPVNHRRLPGLTDDASVWAVAHWTATSGGSPMTRGDILGLTSDDDLHSAESHA